MQIYTISHPITKQVVYIGQTIVSLPTRLDGHIQDSKRFKYKLCNWITKLRNEKLKPVIENLDTAFSIEELDYLEIFYIALFKSWGFDLKNHNSGGKKGNNGYKATLESREKRKRFKEANHMYGKHHSEETKLKISLGNKGQKRDEKFCKRRSEIMKGRKPSQSVIDKMTKTTAKTVIQLDLNMSFIKEFYPISLVEKEGFSDSKVIPCCKNQRLIHKGFIWMYKEDYLNITNEIKIEYLEKIKKTKNYRK